MSSEQIRVRAGTWTKLADGIELWSAEPWTVVINDGVVDIWGNHAGGRLLVRRSESDAAPKD